MRERIRKDKKLKWKRERDGYWKERMQEKDRKRV